MKNRLDNLVRFAIVAALLVCTAAAAWADTDVDQSRDASADIRLSIQNVAGSLEITGWDKNEVSITGTLEKDIEELRIDGDEDDMEIEVVIPKRLRGRNKEIDADLVVRVPRGARLDVGAVSADVTLRGVEGESDIGTVSGRIDIHDGPRRLGVSSVSGEVIVASPTDRASVETVSGMISLNGCRGELSVSSVSGDVDLSNVELKEFSFSSVSGDLELEGSITERGSWKIDGHSGDVVLRLPGDLDARFEIRSFSGDIANEFGPEARRTSKFAPGRELDFTAGKGRADIDVDMFSGDLELLKR